MMSRDPRRSGLKAAADWAMIDGGEYAARMGQGVCRWVNDLVPNSSQVVLTAALAPGLVYNIPSGKRLMLTQYCYAVETASDNCQFEFGFTTQADGAGTFVPLGPHKHVATGAANTGRTAFDQEIVPAEPISYARGARCVTFRVDANDAACEITMGWHGWLEDE